MSNDRIVIVGAGMAGVATAWFLTQRGARDIHILEKETMAGTHSSGLNAAILRTMIPEPVLNRMALESADFYLRPPAGFSGDPLVERSGIYLAASTGNEPTLRRWCEENPATAMQATEVAAVYQRVPELAPGLGMATWKADDGIMDIHAILQSFLRGAQRAGAKLCTATEFLGLRVENNRLAGVETSAGFMAADKVVIASGAWAARADLFGAWALPFTPYRRHLLVTGRLDARMARWPVVWIAGEEFYFRPESGGLLLCGCDAVAVTPEQGEVVDATQLERVAAKAARWLPGLADVPVAKAWAGMRTFVPDDLFVIGADPRLAGLCWVAGLGGHGITCAPSIGRLAADCVLDGHSDYPAAAALSPARLCR